MTRTITARERLVLVAGATIVAILLAYVAVFEIYLGSMQRLDRTITTRTRQVAELTNRRSEIQALQQQIGTAEGKLGTMGGFSLISYAEAVVDRIAGRAALIDARPLPANLHGEIQESTLEVKIERVTLQQALLLLWEFENAPVPLRIDALQVTKRYDAPSHLDLTMTVIALQKVA